VAIAIEERAACKDLVGKEISQIAQMVTDANTECRAAG